MAEIKEHMTEVNVEGGEQPRVLIIASEPESAVSIVKALRSGPQELEIEYACWGPGLFQILDSGCHISVAAHICDKKSRVFCDILRRHFIDIHIVEFVDMD